MAYKEIVTKAVIGKGKKKYKNSYQITVEQAPSTVLGCWIINHNFSAKETNDKIVIKGAKEHNLKNIDLTIPRDKLIVMTGLSGSGKSSLAFDTL